jgi:hypothetical protein
MTKQGITKYNKQIDKSVLCKSKLYDDLVDKRGNSKNVAYSKKKKRI